MDTEERLTYLNTTLAALEHAWPRVLPELHVMIDDLTVKLVSAEDEQTRGAIKVLNRLLVLPELLASERDHITQDE